jgi:hypothetical protein
MPLLFKPIVSGGIKYPKIGLQVLFFLSACFNAEQLSKQTMTFLSVENME